MNKLIKKVAPWVLVGTLFLSLPGVAFAQLFDLSPTGDFGELDFELPALIAAILRLLLVLAALIFFVMLLIGGIQWMISGGDKTATEAARNKITAALVGLLIVFSAWAIAALIHTFFGVDILQLTVTGIER